MNYDEFAFFNQQLAAMLRDDIPLEGGLRRLCAHRRGDSLATRPTALPWHDFDSRQRFLADSLRWSS